MSRFFRTTGAVIPLCVTVAGCASSSGKTPVTARTDHVVAPSPLDTISPERLRGWLGAFADDSMMGRQAGTKGHFMASAFLAREARGLGLEPAGENGGFFQSVPMTERTLNPATSLTLGDYELQRGTDFVPLPPIQGIPVNVTGTIDGVPVIYAGRLRNEPLLTPEQARGKLVVVGANLGPDGAPIFALSPSLFALRDAAAIALANLDYAPRDLLDFLQGTHAFLSDNPGPPPSGPLFFFISDETAARIMGAPLDEVETGRSGTPLRGNLEFTDAPMEWEARNVVAVLPGRDSMLRGEYVAIGAHSDHIGFSEQPLDHDSLRAYLAVVRPEGADSPQREATDEEEAQIATALRSARQLHPPRPDSISNGADDDGSGSVTLLAVADALSRHHPKRSVLFVWHTAEEMGLFGSEYYTDHPTVPRDSIVAQINIDMIGRGNSDDIADGGPHYLQILGSRRLSRELGDLVERVNSTGLHAFDLDYQFDADGHPGNYYCRSDQWNYARYGIPVVFLSTGGHRDYHQVTDEPQYINYGKLARVGRFVGAIARAVADLDHRLVVDHPAPDPAAPCKQ